MPSNRCSIAHWEWDMRSSFFICICIYFWHMPNSWISRFIVVQHTTILCCCWCLILKVPGEANIIPSYMYLLLVVGVCVLYTTYMHNYWCIELSRSRIKNKFCVLFFDFYFILFLHNNFTTRIVYHHKRSCRSKVLAAYRIPSRIQRALFVPVTYIQ